MGKHINVSKRIGKDNNHYYLGDTHFLVRGYPMKTLNKMIKIIKDDPNATFSLGGDIIDAMNVQDSRYMHGQYEGNSDLVDAQIIWAVKKFKPIADKLLWVLYGNHERRVWNITDVAKRIAAGLGCDCYGNPEDKDYMLPDNRSVMMVKADFGAFKVLNGHWEWYVNSMANDDYIAWENERRSLKKRMCKIGGVDDCEAVVCHHIHKIHVIPPSKPSFMKMISTKSGKLITKYPKPNKIWIDKKNDLYYYNRDDRWYGSSGAFMASYVDGFSTYAERKGYKATEMGCVMSIIENNKFKGLKEIKL